MAKYKLTKNIDTGVVDKVILTDVLVYRYAGAKYAVVASEAVKTLQYLWQSESSSPRVRCSKAVA